MKRLSFLPLLILFALACGLANPINPWAKSKSDNCWVDVPSNLSITCRYITVPESRDPALADDSNDIRLAVMRIRSTSANPAPDPVIYLDGGPGGYTIEFADFYISEFADILATRDLILFDQRGVGYSEPNLSCPNVTEMSYDLLDDDLSYVEANTLYNEAYFTCRETLLAQGANLYAYTSAENAADVRAIAEAFGYEQVNLFGISYGTRLALTVMRDHPDIVRSVVLDAVYPPNVDSEEVFLLNMQRAFDKLFDGCAQDPDCNAQYPDLETVFHDTVDRLNETPELIRGYFDGYTGVRRDVLVNGDLLIGQLFSLLYGTSDIPAIPGYIYAASEGDYEGFLDDAMFSLYFNQYFSDGMYYFMECYEEVGFNDGNEVLASLDRVPPQIETYYTANDDSNADDYIEFCARWTDNQFADPIENAAVVSDIPTLVTVGEYDPITPPEWALIAAETLSNHYYYEYPGVGHSAYFGGNCPARMIVAFIEDPTRAPDDSCLASMSGPDFQ